VLGSAVGPNREEAIKAAMAAAGVTELVEGERPATLFQRMTALAQPKLESDLNRLLNYVSENEHGLKASLKRCSNAVGDLIGALR
jgi:hypothetical protein